MLTKAVLVLFVCLCYKLYETPGCINQPWKINKNWWKALLWVFGSMPAAPTVLTPVGRSLECRFYYNLSSPEKHWLSSEHRAVLNWVFMQWIDITDGERCCCSLESLPHQGCEACYIFSSIIFISCPCVHFQSTQGRPMYWHTPQLL